MAAGDLNADGHVDLVIADHYSTAGKVLLGNGDGSFVAQPAFPTAGGPSKMALADLSGDAILDLALSDWGARSVSRSSWATGTAPSRPGTTMARLPIPGWSRSGT
jgi:hypothetical protein